MSTTINRARVSEADILAGVLSEGRGRQMPDNIARYILDVGFSDDNKARMHDLAFRNQSDDLSAAGRDELFAFAKAGTVLSILKVKARRVLRLKPKKRMRS